MNLPHWIPQNPPKYVKITMIVTICFFSFIGLGICLPLLEYSFGKYLVNVLYYVFLGLIGAAVILFAFQIFSKVVRRHTEEHLAAQYQNQGMCLDMAETLKAIMPAPTERDLVLRSFILVMSEHFHEAELQMSRINQQTLSMREFSMLMTSKIRLYMMTGKMEKAGKLLEQNQVKMELAYENKPDYFDDYRAYADDAFEFYMLAAVYYDLIRQPESAENYRKKAEFQVSGRSAAELEFYKHLLELNRLYVTRKTQEAHILENEMRGMAEHFNPPIPQGLKNDLLRAAEQAKVFSAATDLVNVEIMQQRQLPTGDGAALPEGFTAM